MARKYLSSVYCAKAEVHVISWSRRKPERFGLTTSLIVAEILL
jgi:hypothetical protein